MEEFSTSKLCSMWEVRKKRMEWLNTNEKYYATETKCGDFIDHDECFLIVHNTTMEELASIEMELKKRA